MTNPLDPLNNITPPVNPSSVHSLQAFIELVYVQAANDVLLTNLAALHSALSTTNATMQALTALQNLHNDISVKSVGTFNFNYATAADKNAFIQGYKSAASSFFGKPVQVQVSLPRGVTMASAARQAVAIEAQLSTQIIPLLTSTTPPSSATDPNSLLSLLKVVLADLKGVGLQSVAFDLETALDLKNQAIVHNNQAANQAYNTALQQWLQLPASTRATTPQPVPPVPVDQIHVGLASMEDPSLIAPALMAALQSNFTVYTNGLYSTAFTKWVIDNNNATSISTAGKYQQDLINAMTAGETLNTTQTESVRNYLFLFEEYYKSATAILQQMTQIIQQIAQNLSH